jgi:hypothetical protein
MEARTRHRPAPAGTGWGTASGDRHLFCACPAIDSYREEAEG